MRLLCVCYEMPPETTPTGIRTGKLLGRLIRDGWDIDVVTAATDAALAGATIRRVPPPPPSPWRHRLVRWRLAKLSDLTSWVDDKRAWAAPATAAALELVAARRPDAVVVFMMPYAAGLVGLELKRRGLPVVMNFDDSPTCDDMHASFATAAHHRRAVAFEDQLVRAADAVVYVSQRTLDRVRDRQPAEQRGKFHLVRYGADPPASPPPEVPADGVFRIRYIGALSGWYAFGSHRQRSALVRLAQRLLAAWDRAGRHTLVELDQRGSSPVFVARAAKAAMAADASLRVRVEVYGNRYPADVAAAVLDAEGVADVVDVHGPVPNDRAVELARGADLLFLALPARADGSAGGRISAKTYEYLMTDRPILAAVPAGENADYMRGFTGTWVVPPNDVDAMAAAIAPLSRAKRDGRPDVFDRTARRAELSYDTRAAALAHVLADVVGPSDHREGAHP
jgi:glycosyltransferase involved in cell wall biosynthesis